MWPWLLVIAGWGVVMLVAAYQFEIEWLFWVSVVILGAVAIAAFLLGTYEYLVWAEAWGFEPR